MHRVSRCRRAGILLVAAGLFAASLTVVGFGAEVPPAAAANDGSLEFTKSAPGSILYGEDVTYTLTATNNGTGADGYNLTFRDVLPRGVTFVSSSAGTPTIFEDFPGPGSTTLLFENVADLQSGVTEEITITVDIDETEFAVGDRVDNTGGAYMSGDVRQIPDFSATGVHENNTDTSAFATQSVSTDIEAIEIEKFEGNSEEELLRGVHTEWTTYGLTVSNNLVNPTDTVIVEDYLPAGLEFLGCGSIDHTDAVPVTNLSASGLVEYDGATALGVGVAPVDPSANGVTATCRTPTLVETVTLAADEEFPGQEAGVYTHVVWDLSADPAMAATDQFELMYAAGIPLRENTATFETGHLAIGDDTADLDNNNGSFTTDEQELTNWSRVSGNYNPGIDDRLSTDDDSWTVRAEDLSIHKSVDDPEFTQAELPGWTMLLETGEYRDATGLVVTDQLPDGQCPILSTGDPETVAPINGECAQTGGLPVPTVAGATDDPDTVTEAADGSWTMVWSTIPDLGLNDDYEITFSSRIRVEYQEDFDDDTPVVGADVFSNDVDIFGTTSPITDVTLALDLDRATETTLDESSAGQVAGVVVINKSVSQPTAPGVALDCDAATYTAEVPPTTDQADWAYRPGDRVCYHIVVDFLSNLHFRNPIVADFIPPGAVFEQFWGDDPDTGQVFTGPSDVVIDEAYDNATGPGTAPGATTTDGLNWALGTELFGDGDLYVDNTADHFEVVFSVLIAETRHQGDDPTLNDVDILDNLAKLKLQNNDNSGGISFSSRDQAAFPHVEPHIILDKRNSESGDPTDDDGESGVQNDVFDFEVDITNDFEAGATAAENLYATAFAIRTWDILPADIVCADLTTGPTLTTGETVSCLDPTDVGYPLAAQATAGRSVLEMTIVDLAPQEVATLSYSITVPPSIAAGRVLTNDAGVRDYDGSAGNAGTTTTYVPESNIDEDNVAAENTSAARDSATVTIRNATIAKVQTSSDTDPSGGTNLTNTPASTATQDATIGERVTYTVDATIPEGTDLYDATIVDDLADELDFESLDAGSLSLDNGTSSLPLTITTPTDGYFDVDGSGTQTAADVVVGVTGGDVLVTFPPVWNNDPGTFDDLVSLTYTTLVNSTANAGDQIVSVSDLDWESAAGVAADTLSTLPITTVVVEPNPQIAKSDDGTDTDVPPNGISDIDPGDPVTYSLVVTNPDAGTDNTSVAHDLVVTDVLPIGVSFDEASAIDNPDGGVFTAGVPAGALGTITWTEAEVLALAARAVGDSLTLTYSVSVDDPATASGVLTNTATVTAQSRAADGPASAERTTYTDSDTTSLELPAADLAKDLAPFDADPFDGTDTDLTDYNVGEAIDFQLTAAIPANSRSLDMVAFDDLPAFLQFDAYGAAVFSGPECARSGGGPLTAGDVIGLTPSGQTLGWYLGDVAANGAECRITLPYSVHVDSVATTASTGSNSATIEWNGTNDITTDPATVAELATVTWSNSAGPEAETVNVLEPILAIDKDVQLLDPGPTVCEPSPDADTCATESGATHRFTVTVTNSGDGDAHDLTIVDTLPAAGAGVPFNFTGTPAPVYSGAGPRTLTWSPSGPILAGGGSITFTYDVVIGPSSALDDNEVLVNSADVASYFGMSTLDRAAAPVAADVPQYGGLRNPVTADTNSLTIQFPDLVIAKAPAAGVDATDARVGVDFRWRLEVFNDGPVPAYNIDVDDVLPADWVYVAGSAQIDTGAGLGALFDPAGGPSGPLLWDNVVAQLDPGGSFVIEFDTQPQAPLLSEPTTGVFDHVNDSGVNGEDAGGATTNNTGSYGDDNGAPDGGHGSDDASARIRRVDLTVDKTVVESAPYFFGDFITYRVTVTNDDSGVSVDTATGVTVTDVLPTEVVFDSSSTANGAYSETTDVWTLASALAPGASATLDIVVRINAPTAFTNIAEVEAADQWDIDSTPGNNDNGVGPNEDDDDSVVVTPTNADLGNRIWFDTNADGIQDIDEPGIVGVDVEVAWVDPGSGLTITRTATTNTDGEYSFSDLPQDIPLTVTVDPSTRPPGLAPTFELVDSPDVTDTQANNAETGALDGVVSSITLTGTTPSYLDVDFGYTGTGSIGDYVWYDIDLDGVQDVTEVGLDGIDIVVEWAGFDGVRGDDPSTPLVDESIDDVDYATTTAFGGLYTVGNLAAGDYTVRVDTDDLPNGIDNPTWDLDFDTSGDPADLDSVSTYTLSTGENYDGVDFGYAGPGSLGDTIWLDLDADGIVDPEEGGFGGVPVTVTFVEPGGTTIVLTTTTEPDGTYLFEGLPLDIPLTVTVDTSALPDHIVATHDLDDTADGTTTAATPDAALVTLTTARPDRLDADFGYVGLGSIGDTVWLDLDASGETDPQPDDILLEGVGVTLTYTNPGGIDIVLTTTTDASGNYLFEGLPDGDYTVEIDPTTLPAGVDPIVDPDGGDDNMSAVTLDDDDTTVENEAIDLDQDFAYVGTGSIGDLVWNDVDNLGVVDPGEAGIGGVDLTIVWIDPVTGATATIVTTTAADGSYLVENLPAGNYTISIDPDTLPEGMTPTYDLDGVLDRIIDIVLAPGEDRRDIDFGERREADLAITKTSDGEFAVGGQGEWTFTVTNNGPALADGTITVTDDLPEGLTPVTATAPGWTCATAGTTFGCTYDDGPLAVGESSTIVLVVDVDAAAAPARNNTVIVENADGPVDPNPANDEDTDTVSIPLALLGIEKTLEDTLRTGAEADWRIVVTNFGPSQTNATVTVVDDLPPGLRYVRATSNDFVCAANGQQVTCTTDEVLAVNATSEITITTEVTAGEGQSIVNSISVSGGTVVDGQPLPPGIVDDVSDDAGVTTTTQTPATTILAVTGSEVGRLLTVAFLLLVAGGSLVLVDRRRKQLETVGAS